MKSNHRLIAIAVLGILLGATTMGFYQRLACRKELEKWKFALQARGDRWLRGNLTSSVLDNVETLTGIRRGEIDYLIKLKEDRLSEGIQDILANYPNEALTDTNIIKALKIAGHYRAEHPFKTGEEELDKAVDDILAKIQKSKD